MDKKHLSVYWTNASRGVSVIA